MRKHSAANYAANREQIRAQQREKYRTDPEFRRAIYEDQRARRATPEGREAHNASNRKFKKSERGRLLSRLHAHVRRARLMASPVTLTDEQWVALVEAYKSECAYCGTHVEAAKMWLDHVLAIALGGAHTLENAAPACSKCNQKKSAKPLDVALAHLGVSRETFTRRRFLALCRLGGVVAIAERE